MAPPKLVLPPTPGVRMPARGDPAGKPGFVQRSYPHWAEGWSGRFPPSPRRPPCSCADGAAEEEQGRKTRL